VVWVTVATSAPLALSVILRSDHGAARPHWRVQREALLAVDDPHPVDAGVEIAHPETGIAEQAGERR
jgi:hypothetical protein